jgi:cytochrome c553
MWGLSRFLTESQISGLADYYSKQTVPRVETPDNSNSVVASGKEIFEQGVPDQNVIPCAACHGPKGQGIEAFPRLANQHADYVIKQLNVFQNTQGRPGTPMEAVVHPLTGGNMIAVARYLETLQD